MSEESQENLIEIVSSLKSVTANLESLKNELNAVKEKFSKVEEMEFAVMELRTTVEMQRPLHKDIEEIKQTITELQESVKNQSIKQEELVKPLNTTLEELQSKISAFEGTMPSSLNNTIEELQLKISAFEGNISPSIESLKNDYERNKELITKIENDFSQYKTTMNEKIGQVLALSELSKNTKEDFDVKVEGFTNQINNLEKSIEEISPSIANLESKVEKAATETTDMVGKIEAVSTNVTNIEGKMEETTNSVTDMTTTVEGFLNRIVNLEKKAGISTGDLISSGLDNLGMLGEIVTDLTGEDKVNHYIPKESSRDPIKVIHGLKSIIRDLSFIDETNSITTAEILLKYSERSEERADRRTLIVNFSNDIRRVLEVGQSVLMDIGQKRIQTRNIIEEIRNLTLQWGTEDDLRGEKGVFLAIELLEVLEKEFQ